MNKCCMQHNIDVQRIGKTIVSRCPVCNRRTIVGVNGQGHILEFDPYQYEWFCPMCGYKYTNGEDEQ